MVHKWYTEFRCGLTSTSEALCSRRLVEVTAGEIINKFHDIVLPDRKVKIREIVKHLELMGREHPTETFRHEKAFHAFPHNETEWSDLFMKYGIITTRQKWKNCQNSGLYLESVPRRKERRYYSQ